ncbi:MAG TPA: stage II sporulation protein M [Ignavibacteriaceae bacterium]|nr:stage II sporulation protein M [Ignavibacteriaceae bacterium]
MREAAFLKKNADKWKKFELLLAEKGLKEPDSLAGLLIQLTDDLSYARTFYPGSKSLAYLNSLAANVHQKIYKNKKEEKRRIVTFWKSDLPLLFYKYRDLLLISFAVFFLSFLIGMVSTANDTKFARLILGDSYVNMTIENIEKGDPMAVYKKMNEVDMFLGITFNNIRVSFFAFTAGILLAFGTCYFLFTNGVMLGAFEYFFFQHNVLTQSLLTVWIHGTLEISSIVIAGAAGILLGKSFIFPGTFTRRHSFMIGARDGIKMVFGLIPLFITAGFLESFVTRHTEMPAVVNLLIIGISLSFTIWYVIIYPKKLFKGGADGSAEAN